MTCDRPGCDQPATHRPTVGPDSIDGWEHLCCDHTDVAMAVAGTTVPADEGARGWTGWLHHHAVLCDRPVQPPRSYLRACIDRHTREQVKA